MPHGHGPETAGPPAAAARRGQTGLRRRGLVTRMPPDSSEPLHDIVTAWWCYDARINDSEPVDSEMPPGRCLSIIVSWESTCRWHRDVPSLSRLPSPTPTDPAAERARLRRTASCTERAYHLPT